LALLLAPISGADRFGGADGSALMALAG